MPFTTPLSPPAISSLRTDWQFFHEQKQKKKRESSRTEANRTSLESLHWVPPSSCCTLSSLFTMLAQQQAPKRKQHAHLDIFTWTSITARPCACGTSCLPPPPPALYMNLSSFCSSHPLKLLCNFISLMLQHKQFSWQSLNKIHHRQQKAVKSYLTSPCFIEILPSWRPRLPNLQTCLIHKGFWLVLCEHKYPISTSMLHNCSALNSCLFFPVSSVPGLWAVTCFTHKWIVGE